MNHQNNTYICNNSGTIQYDDVSRNDISNENVRKQSTKRVYIVGDSIVNGVKDMKFHVKWKTLK